MVGTRQKQNKHLKHNELPSKVNTDRRDHGLRSRNLERTVPDEFLGCLHDRTLERVRLGLRRRDPGSRRRNRRASARLANQLNVAQNVEKKKGTRIHDALSQNSTTQRTTKPICSSPDQQTSQQSILKYFFHKILPDEPQSLTTLQSLSGEVQKGKILKLPETLFTRNRKVQKLGLTITSARNPCIACPREAMPPLACHRWRRWGISPASSRKSSTPLDGQYVASKRLTSRVHDKTLAKHFLHHKFLQMSQKHGTLQSFSRDVQRKNLYIHDALPQNFAK